MRAGETAVPAIPQTSPALLSFELAMLELTWDDEASQGCRCCYWKPIEGDGPPNVIHHYDDAVHAIALMAVCEVCARDLSASDRERILGELRPTDFVQARAVNEWGGSLLGDPAADLETKMKAVLRWLASEKDAAQ